MNQAPAPCVFIADDDEDDRFLLGKAFERHSPACQLQFAYDGQDLLDTLATSIRMPDLILLDLNMPRLGGFDVLQALRKRAAYQHTPVVILTTSDSIQDRQQALELGANDFITKPLTVTLLGQAVLKLRADWLVDRCG